MTSDLDFTVSEITELWTLTTFGVVLSDIFLVTWIYFTFSDTILTTHKIVEYSSQDHWEDQRVHL